MDELEIEAPGAPPPERPPAWHRHWMVGWVVVIAIAAVVSVTLRLFVVQTFYVPTASMYPTLQVGDRILVLKLGFSLNRGAIVVFEHPKDDLEGPPNEDLVKRIIGLPG